MPHNVHFQMNGDLNRILNSLNSVEKSEFRPGLNSDKNNNDDENKMNDHARNQFKYTSRSLSVIGVLGGIVLILLVAALSTCVKNRRDMLADNSTSRHQETFARQILIDHIRHLSSRPRGHNSDNDEDAEDEIDRSNDVPPSYEDVVKTTEDEEGAKCEEEDEQQPPSYVEAIERQQQSRGQHVVTIELRRENEES